MADRGDLITTEDFTDLKKMVDSEISRRSADGSIGSMSAYCGAEYQYSTAPSRDIEIGREYIRKITEPLDAIDGVETTPRKGTIILAETMRNALAKLNDLSSRSKTESSTGCRASCTGLCSTGCYSGCSSCAGGCSGCSGCGNCGSGCSGCSGCGWYVF